MKEKKQILVILDAHALIHRSYHAMPSFTSPSGEPMGAVYGVSAVLIKLIRELEPTHIAAAFDREEPTFRHVAYENYKATRAETKSDLIPQFDKVKEIFKAFNIPILEAPGFEADDVIGTLCELFKKEKNLSIIIASGDMDTLQLISGDRVRVYTLRKGIEDTIIYNEEKVHERFSFGPEHITDFKGLKGDPSDNIIGVKGIGEKTATEIIKYYGTIEELYKRLKKEKKSPMFLKERIKKLLIDNEEEAFFSKELATIRRDSPISPALLDLLWRGIPIDSVTKIFRQFHFASLISRLPVQTSLGLETKKEENIKQLTEKTATELDGAGDITLVLEGEKLFVISGGKTFFLEQKDVSILKPLLQNKNILTSDAKAIFHFLGFSFDARFDLKVASWICNSDERIFALEKGADAEPLERKLRTRLEKENLSQIYYQFELPLIPILWRMEGDGILIDSQKLRLLEKKTALELRGLAKDIWHKAGEEFDINSPKQLSHILFDVLGLSTKGIKKTGTKAVSTQFSELMKLKDTHPIIEPLIRHRELAKLLSTYISVLPELAKDDGRVHTTFNQAGTSTGRLSSSNPNLQNIPIRTELGRDIRRAFVASDGFELVSFDYSQLELRIAAGLSGDKKLMEIFRKKEDVHIRTAAEIFHVKLDDVTPEMRRRAKTINFGILYGMGARALAVGMRVTHDEAALYLEEYLKEFPGIEEYRTRINESGRRVGYVETLFGRRRYLPNLRSSFEYVRKEAERMAMNAPIQGTEADLIKRAMIEIVKEFKLSNTGADIKMLLQVHDELVFEIKKNRVSEIVNKIRTIMERAPELLVPIAVDAKSGPNWQDMKIL